VNPAVPIALLALGLVLVVAPRRTRPLRSALERIGRPFSTLVTVVLLGAVYFLLVTPIGLLRRLVGGSPLAPAPSWRPKVLPDPASPRWWRPY
jgi:hypothetical protein